MKLIRLIVLSFAALLAACTSSALRPGLQAPTSHIGLVLPADGAAALAAVAVRDGFLAAWNVANPSERPVVSWHPFMGGAVKDAYQAAVAAGATLIIGPLSKEGVQSLAQFLAQSPPSQAGSSAPLVVALNYLPDGMMAPPQLYQFGLSPTDEARQAARQAWRDGRTRAFVVVPSDEWGQRVRQAFRLQWETLGGSVLYAMNAEDAPEALSATIVQVRGHATDDRDFVFLAAPPDLALRCAPMLRQTGLPVYATSSVLTGTRQDAAFMGMRIVDMPWLVAPSPVDVRVRAEIERARPAHWTTYRRLYALGVDAFRLAGALPDLVRDPNARIAGATGGLALDAQRRITRQGVWAQIEGERLVPLAQ